MNIHEILLRIGGDGESAKDALREVSASLQAFGKQQVTAEAEVATAQAQVEIAALEARLLALDKRKVTPRVELDTANTLLQLQKFKAQLADTDRDTRRASSGMAYLTKRAKDLGETLLPDSVRLGAFSFSLSRAGLAVLSLGAAITKALLGALAAMAASLTQAVMGLGALGVAAGAALGPMAALALGAVTRFKSASDAAEELTQAQERVTQASEAQRTAEQRLADAQQAARDASKGLADARKEAAIEAREALLAMHDAEVNLAESQRDVLFAQEAVNEAREAAARALIDMRLAAEGANLSEERAVLNLKRARNELRAIQKNPAAASMALKDARLSVEEAELALQGARIDSQRAQEDLNDAESEGVEGSDQVTTARQALADAQRAAADSALAFAEAQREVRLNQREGIRGDEQVVAARRAFTDANRSVIDSQRELTQATNDLRDAQKEVNQLQREAAAIAPGTAAFKLQKAFEGISKAFSQMTAGGADQVFAGLADALNRLGPTMDALRDDFTGLGRAMGDAFRKVGEELASPEWQDFFERITGVATALIPKVNRGFIALSRILRNIADAAAPFLIDGAESLADGLERTAKATKNISPQTIGTMVEHLGAWLELVKQVGRAWLNFAEAAAPAGLDMVRFFSDGAKSLADFFASAEGKSSVEDFFNDTIPLAQSLFGLGKDLLVLFITYGQVLAPALKPVVDVVRELIQTLTDVLRLLTKLPGPLQVLVGGFLAFGPLLGGLKVLKFLLGPIIRGFGTFLGLLARFGAGGALASLGGALAGLGGKIGGLATRALPALGLALRAIPWVGATALVLEYADDVGRAAAELAGFGTVSEEVAAGLAHAQDTLSGRLGLMNFALREVKELRTKEDFYKAFGKNPPWERIQKVMAEGGNLAGKKFVQKAVEGIESEKGNLHQKSREAANRVKAGFASVAPSLKSAGSTIIQSIMDGMKSMFPGLHAVVKKIGNVISDMLPGSEPKDPTSPLRGLDKAGEAVVHNFSRGIRKATQQAAREARFGFGGMTPRVAAAGGGGGRHQTNHFHITTTGGGNPDSRAVVAGVSRNLRARGLSIA